MRAHEFITEADCRPGWQDPERIILPDNLGIVIMGVYLNDKCLTEDVQFLYYNKNIIVTQDDNDNVVFGIRIQKNIIIEYDYEFHKNGHRSGNFTTIENLKEYFRNRVNEYLNRITLGENMNNVTKKDLFTIAPQLEKRMTQILQQYVVDQHTITENSVKNKVDKKHCDNKVINKSE